MKTRRSHVLTSAALVCAAIGLLAPSQDASAASRLPHRSSLTMSLRLGDNSGPCVTDCGNVVVRDRFGRLVNTVGFDSRSFSAPNTISGYDQLGRPILADNLSSAQVIVGYDAVGRPIMANVGGCNRTFAPVNHCHFRSGLRSHNSISNRCR